MHYKQRQCVRWYYTLSIAVRAYFGDAKETRARGRHGRRDILQRTECSRRRNQYKTGSHVISVATANSRAGEFSCPWLLPLPQCYYGARGWPRPCRLLSGLCPKTFVYKMLQTCEKRVRNTTTKLGLVHQPRHILQ